MRGEGRWLAAVRVFHQLKDTRERRTGPLSK
ncbi:hypothetical protein JMJ77_0014713, partial [Colletotrichum scovillei]